MESSLVDLKLLSVIIITTSFACAELELVNSEMYCQ